MVESAGTGPSTSAGRRLPSTLRNVFSNWAGFICSSLISFFLSPFVVHHLGNSAYGIWVLMGSLTGYLGLLNLGVRGAVTRYVAQLHAEAKDREASAIASSALLIFVAAGTLAIFISWSVAALVVRLFHVPPDLQFPARAVVILAGFNVAVSLVSGVFGGIVAALHRFDLSNLIDTANAVCSAIAIVGALLTGRGLITLSLINLVFVVAVGFSYAGVVFRLYPTLALRLSLCSQQSLKMVFSFSVYTFLLQISANVIFYTDSLVIGRYLSINMITFFAIAGNLMNYSRSLIGGISTTMTPRASALAVSGDLEEVQGLFTKATRLATLMVLPIATTFLLRGITFIRLWMGRDYANVSGRVLWILTLALIFVAAGQVASSVMVGIDKYKPVVWVVCCEALCNLVLSIVLARSMGVFGVAWGTTLPSLAVSLFFWPSYVYRTLRIPVLSYVTSTWIRPSIAVIPFGALSYEIEKLWPASSLLVFFSQVGGCLIVFMIASWFIGLTQQERAIYAEKLLNTLLNPSAPKPSH